MQYFVKYMLLLFSNLNCYREIVCIPITWL